MHDGKSTDGVDIDRTCQIRKSDGEWIVGEVETEKMERIKRLLQAVDITHKEKETTAKQSLPLKHVHSTEELSNKEVKGLLCNTSDIFTPHAIYLLVADIREDIKHFKPNEEFNSIGDYIDFWFDCIHCFCKDGSDHGNQLCPPVLMVCTCTDDVEKSLIVNVANANTPVFIQHNVDKIDRMTSELNYGDKVIKDFQITLLKIEKWIIISNLTQYFSNNQRLNRRGIYFVSNKEEGNEEIVNLKSHISRIATQMEYFAEKLPTKWIHLENALAVLKDLDIDVYEWENMLKIAQKNSVEEAELFFS
ncbi:unnamed protein product [Mytilus edulis]|uniref:Uncharacterized protein n=1 Tax=Mytilus edulis TaxID=6550 RepID=A0A8S3PQ38_MYTED|nr:unnamed protein product [Mytilus edulis]